MSKDKIVVMGVSGSGKSLIGEQLASRLDIPFFDADDFHSPDNVRKMADGIPLSDADRAGWLEDLAELLRREPTLVLACSALKASYRELLRQASPELVFLYLKGDFSTIRDRLALREDHYFNGEAMLRNQFEQLEAPDTAEAYSIDVHQDADAVLNRCLYIVRC